MASILRSIALSRSAAAHCIKASNGWQQQRRLRLAPAPFRVQLAAEASQPYPQTVNLDKGKAKTAQLQSETSKANDGHVDPKEPASKARSAASQSQHVVNMLTEHDPVNAEDVSNISKAEAAASATGQTQRGGPAAKAQGAVSQLKEVRDRKLADKDVINQKDAAQITAAEAKHDGQTPPSSISAKAQSAADKAEQAGIASNPK
ncbi:MAG: hypothetical protein FRX49_00420 [Trebouxia sp. A1-2]|nr:MAG: hypothetical protein FRX49_00420 [Trebouxia sp. A1-2]